MSLRNLWCPHWSHVGLHLMQFLVELVCMVTQIGDKVGLLLQKLFCVASWLHEAQGTAGAVRTTQNIRSQLGAVELTHLV